MSIRIGDQLILLELIDEQAAEKLYGHEWMKGSFIGKLGEQSTHAYYGKGGYCVWNYYNYKGTKSMFDKAFKKIGTFVIKAIK